VDFESSERSTLLGAQDATGIDAIFIPLLDQEVKKIVAFYTDKEKELLEELEELEKDVLKMDDMGLGGGYHYEDYADDDDEDDDSIASHRSPDDARRSPSRHRKSSSAGRVRRNTRSC
jgi:phosphate transporter